jgi:hypothetical protein
MDMGTQERVFTFLLGFMAGVAFGAVCQAAVAVIR